MSSRAAIKYSVVYADRFALLEYATKLKKPIICHRTSHRDRPMILEAFKTSKEVNTIFISKMVENSTDIPEANMIILISSDDHLRHQRIDRILRAKGNHQDRAAGGKEEGYDFKVISSLPPSDSGPHDLSYQDSQDQLALLSKILNAGDNAVIGLENFEEYEQGLKVRQTASGMVYIEYNTGQKRPSYGLNSKPENMARRFPLSSKRYS
ncbi:OLC1v1036835C1 [Oldenlandia corymbosa var. corymbosa]|uniref:OLC1v1036835C1 n=1 Tax=Oldenlandia corymbosa var. corymbosa TaxID=529605 RepID=A0AAV1CWW0_OLDCO|nr:OLC1v1036835C1 [Oldenlandia corymbosa var. corymbosa]